MNSTPCIVFSKAALLRQVQRHRDAQAGLAFTYSHVAATRDGIIVPRYDNDSSVVVLGTGDEAFAKACEALRRWGQFPSDWCRVDPADARATEGITVTMSARVFGVWWINACRVVYTIDETRAVDGTRRFGVAYGTLPGHVEEGEELFLVEQHSDGTVTYEIRAFSRPRYWPVKIGYFLARRLQARFVKDSHRRLRSFAAV